MSQIRYRGACTIPKDVPLHSILVGGGVENTNVSMDKAKKRYAIGRTNPSDRYASSSYHALPWFNCVVAQTSGTRFQIIAEIK